MKGREEVKWKKYFGIYSTKTEKKIFISFVIKYDENSRFFAVIIYLTLQLFFSFFFQKKFSLPKSK